MIASAQTEIFDLQGAVIFKWCSAYPATQPPPSLPPSLPQGVGEIGNNKTGTEEIQVILLGGLWNVESYQAMSFYWLLGESYL